MNFFTKLSDWFRPNAASGGKSDLQTNMEKALAMKQAAGPQSQIPEHRTADKGMRDHTSPEDNIPATQGSYTPELKRSGVARSGDAS